MQDLVAKHEIVIDVAKKAFVEIEVVKGSRRSILLKFFFVENGEKFDMQNVKLAEIKGTTPGGGRVFKDLDVLEDGSIEYLISDTILGESGKTTCELQLIGPYGEVLVCHEISIKVLPNSFDENEYVAEDDISAVRAYVMRAEKAAETSEGVKEYVGKTTESYQMLEEELQQTKEEFENYTDKVKERIENGEFIGPPGIQGKAGKQGEPGKQGKQGIQGKTGESGIVTPASGYFTLSVDEDGNVYANYADEDHPPKFEMDEEMNVYLLMDDDTKVFIGNVKPQSNQVQKAVNTYLEEHPVEEGKVDLPKTANGYDYGYAGQVAVGNGAGAVEWKNPEVKYYGTLEEMLADEQLYNYMFAVVVGENDTLDGRSATYFIYDKPVNGSVKLEKRELYACKIPVWYVSTNEQALTDGQKEQVRENIGAAAKADVEEKEKRLEEEILNLAIKPTTDPATSLHIQDSAKYRVLDIGMSGKTEQATTTGKNFLGEVNSEVNAIFDGLTGTIKGIATNNTALSMVKIHLYKDGVMVDYNEMHSNSGKIIKPIVKDDTFNQIRIGFNGNEQDQMIGFNCNDLQNGITYYLQTNVGTIVENGGIISNVMITTNPEYDEVYEPYTGGAASPNPNYPQEIEHAGRYNVESGRYEVDVEVCNKNLIPYPYVDTTVTRNGVTFTDNGDGSVTAQGTANRQAYFRLNQSSNFDKDINAMGKDSGTNGEYSVNAGLYYNEENKMLSINIKSGVTVDRIYYPQLELGTVSTPYSPHESQQTTISSERPITKWDRLEKRDGVYGWVYKSKKYIFDGTETWGDYATYKGFFNESVLKDNLNRAEGYCNQLICDTNGFKGIDESGFFWLGVGGNAHMYVPNCVFYDESLEDKGHINWVNHLKEHPLEIWTYTDTEEFVPVSEEEQAMLEALETYYGVTNITNSEECDMSIQYVADTKLYMDNKILEIQSAVI